VLDARTGAIRFSLDRTLEDESGGMGNAVAASPHGLLVGDSDNFSVNLYDHSNGAFVRSFTLPEVRLKQFGVAVAWLGTEVLVGAPSDGDTANYPYCCQEGPGAVYVFDGATGALLRRLASPHAMDADGFGASLVTWRDGFAVGAPGRRVPSPPGAVFVFDRRGTFVRELRAPEPAPGDLFGASLAATDSGLLLVGMPSVHGAGAAHLFAHLVPQPVETFVGGRGPAHDGFGLSVALGAGGALIGGIGSADLFDPSTGATIASLVPPDVPTTFFGASVVIVGNTLVVDAPGHDVSAVCGYRPLRR
jgi:hypothetical protein